MKKTGISTRPVTAKVVTTQSSTISSRLMKPTISSQIKSRAGNIGVQSGLHASGNEAVLARRLEKDRVRQDYNQIARQNRTPPPATPQNRERRTRAERSDKFEKFDTVAALNAIDMDKSRGHAYDWQDAEVGMFKNQQIERLSAQPSQRMNRSYSTLNMVDTSPIRAVAPKSQIGKVINSFQAKSPEKKPVDRAAVRRIDYSRLQDEIKQGALEKSRGLNLGLKGFDAGCRQTEISATRAKNNMSSISTLPGSQAAEIRLHRTIKRDASTREIDQLDLSFGGAPKSAAARPIMNRNKSFVEIGERNKTFTADHFKKETVNRTLLQNATESQRILYPKHDHHAKSQYRSNGAKVALNPIRFTKENNVAWKPKEQRPQIQRRGMDLQAGIMRQSQTTFFSLA